MLKVTECVEVKTNQDGHYLRIRHYSLAATMFSTVRGFQTAFSISELNSLLKSSAIQNISVILLVLIIRTNY